MITVVNKVFYTPVPGMDFYIGRDTPLGNPYTSKKNPEKTRAIYACETKEEAISNYRQYLHTNLNIGHIPMYHQLVRLLLASKRQDINLVCWCAPAPCHGNVLKEIIEHRSFHIPWLLPYNCSCGHCDESRIGESILEMSERTCYSCGKFVSYIDDKNLIPIDVLRGHIWTIAAHDRQLIEECKNNRQPVTFFDYWNLYLSVRKKIQE